MALNFADFYDAELVRHNAYLRAVAGVGLCDRVLNVGCGAGHITNDLIR